MSDVKTVDARGMACPLPVLEAKKALAEYAAVKVMVDNATAVQNLEAMARGSGYDFAHTAVAADEHHVTITRTGDAPRDASGNGGLVVAIGRDTMGAGAEELGKILLKGFVGSLVELTPPPECVIFFNSGARLTSDGANTLSDLQTLEAHGTKILTCGTCVNYYALTPSVGAVTNMYEIARLMAAAASVINV